ncbi:hypothetical protein EYC80_005364 [Monilinia laxa]|uniref:Uncharacterized protein n=1 Tax=Monilinia laxa TaxID=61186 RepID=A0A5N6KJR1_MONLA|nr:hypothetical protein EYC80_005364 [Monilinia laxa]
MDVIAQDLAKNNLVRYTRPPGGPLFQNGETENPLATLYFFDSQGGAPFKAPPTPDPIPNYVTSPIVSWFLATRSYLASNTEMTSRVWRLSDVSLPNYPGLDKDLPLAAQGNGVQDLSFMQALVSRNGLHSVHSGHDHGDSWCGGWPINEVVPGREKGMGPFCVLGNIVDMDGMAIGRGEHGYRS